MPLKRNYSKSNRRPRRRDQKKKKGPSNKTLSRKVRHIENNLIELKYKDFYDAIESIPDTGSFALYQQNNFIEIGDAANQRTGNSVAPVSLILRFNLSTVSTLLNGNRVRVIVFWDTQTNGAAPTSGTIFDTSIVIDATQAPRNQENISRYIFLWDKVITLNPMNVLTTTAGTTTATIPFSKHFIKHIKLSRMIRYNGNTQSITDCTTNSIGIAFTSDITGGTIIDGIGARMYFRDA